MAARRVAKSSLDWAAFYETVPSREREIYKALKNRSDYFVNKVHSNPASLPKIDFARYKNVLPGLKMVEEFEKSYEKVTIPYPSDKDNLAQKIKQEEAQALAQSTQRIQTLENEKVLSTQFLAKMKELPKREDFTMEMFNEYFPWTRVKDPAHPKLFPFNKASQPENLKLNESDGINRLFSRVGIKVKV